MKGLSRTPALLALALIVLVLSPASAVQPGVVERANVGSRSARPPAYPPPIDLTASAQSVIGDDDRYRVSDTSSSPWSAIAWLGLYDSGGAIAGNCTGTFVGPDTLITAAHCVWTPDAGFVRDIVVVPGKDGPNEPFGYEFAANWWVPDDYIATAGESVHDWAIVALASRRLGSAAGWFRLSALSTATLTDPSFVPAVFGYPADRPEGTLWGTVSAGFTTVSGEELTYEIDTSPGESGAPIFSLGNAGGHAGDLVGIHRFGSPDAGPNGGSRIDDRFIADLIDACETMGCTIEAYRER